MPEPLIICRRAIWERTAVIVLFGFVALAGIANIYIEISHNIRHNLTESFVLTLGCLAAIFIIFRQRIIATESEVVMKWSIPYSLKFTDIKKVAIYHGMVTLETATRSMMIPYDITNREQLLEHIHRQVSARTDIDYEGDSRDLLRFFGKVPNC